MLPFQMLVSQLQDFRKRLARELQLVIKLEKTKIKVIFRIY